MRFFNTAGPCDPKYHYMLPAAERLPEAPKLVERGMYFVVHAPRQTGKTTALRALAERITAEGNTLPCTSAARPPRFPVTITWRPSARC